MSDFRLRVNGQWMRLRRVFSARRPQLPRLLETHRGGGEEPALEKIARDAREKRPSFERCQVCSLCTFSCVAVREGTAPPAFEPKSLLLGAGRGESDGALTLALWVPCAECAACTVECPNEVPVHEVASALIARERR